MSRREPNWPGGEHAGFLLGLGLFTLGHAYLAKGEYEAALGSYHALREYAEAAGDKWWITRTPNCIGGVHLELYDLDEAIRLDEENDDLAKRLWPWPEPRGHSLLKLGLAHLYRGDQARAQEAFQQAWALLEEDAWGRWRWHIPLLCARGELALAAGRYDEAWSYATQSLEMAIQTDSRKHVVRAQRLQGDILAASGRLDEAVRTLDASVRLAESLQTPREVWLGQAALGKVLARLGREHEAEAHFLQAAHTIEALADNLRPEPAPEFFGGCASRGHLPDIGTDPGHGRLVVWRDVATGREGCRRARYGKAGLTRPIHGGCHDF